jgi:hypothetical protein
MKRVVMIGLFVLLAACQPSQPADPRTLAQQFLDAQGRSDANITQVLKGNNPAQRDADELWCIETDALADDGQTPYLMVVWRKGSTWETAFLAEGEYAWDLHGCPR